MRRTISLSIFLLSLLLASAKAGVSVYNPLLDSSIRGESSKALSCNSGDLTVDNKGKYICVSCLAPGKYDSGTDYCIASGSAYCPQGKYNSSTGMCEISATKTDEYVGVVYNYNSPGLGWYYYEKGRVYFRAHLSNFDTGRQVGYTFFNPNRGLNLKNASDFMVVEGDSSGFGTNVWKGGIMNNPNNKMWYDKNGNVYFRHTYEECDWWTGDCYTRVQNIRTNMVHYDIATN